MEAKTIIPTLPDLGNTDEKEGHNDNQERQLEPHHLEMLRERGISEETARRAGLYTYRTVGEATQLLGLGEKALRPNAPGLVIPYPGCDGYAKLRPDNRLVPNLDHDPKYLNGPSAQRAEYLQDEPPFIEGPKYFCPRSTSRVYFPFGINDPLLVAGKARWVTEGEFKALALCQAGVPAVALQGADNGGDGQARRYAKAQGQDVRQLHPDLVRMGVKGKEFILCFDSDVDTNPNVLAALHRFGGMLVEGGAQVSIAYVPKREGFEKTGVDDHLAKPLTAGEERYHVTRLGELEESVRPFNLQEVLKWLAAQWADWSGAQREVEVQRAARLARLMYTQGYDFDNWCRDAGRTLAGVNLTYLRNLAPKPEAKQERVDARQYFAGWVERRQVQYRYGAQNFVMAGVETRYENLLAELKLDALKDNAGLSKDILESLLKLWKDGQERKALESYRAKLAHRPGGDRELRAWLRAVTGGEDQVDLAVMQHFVWQVKRKLNGLKVERHIMPVFKGRQDGGKTEAIRKLLRPVVELTDPVADMAKLTDERSHFRMVRSYVVFCDEMAKADRVDMDALKHLITEERLHWRVLGLNATDSGANNATFIGASNNSVQDLIRDSTGMRRFYQVNCMATLDWNAINAVDAEAIWTSVDERLEFKDTPLGAGHILAECKHRQEDLRAKSALEEWFEAYCAVDLTGKQKISSRDACDAFNRWLWDSRHAPAWTQAKFGRDLKELLDKKHGEGAAYHKSSKMQFFIDVSDRSAGMVGKLLQQASPAKA